MLNHSHKRNFQCPYQRFKLTFPLSTFGGFFLNSDVIVDTKGRILIPKDIREKLNILPGVRFLIKIEDGRLVLLRTTSLEDFQSEIETFQEKLKKLTSDPIPTEKLF